MVDFRAGPAAPAAKAGPSRHLGGGGQLTADPFVPPGCATGCNCTLKIIRSRDAIFRKITNQNQTDTNEMATTETKYQTDFYSAPKYQYLTKFKKIVLKIPIKYQENTKKFGTEITEYRFGFGIFLVYQILVTDWHH